MVVTSKSHFANIPPSPSEGEAVSFTAYQILSSFGEHRLHQTLLVMLQPSEDEVLGYRYGCAVMCLGTGLLWPQERADGAGAEQPCWPRRLQCQGRQLHVALQGMTNTAPS